MYTNLKVTIEEGKSKAGKQYTVVYLHLPNGKKIAIGFEDLAAKIYYNMEKK